MNSRCLLLLASVSLLTSAVAVGHSLDASRILRAQDGTIRIVNQQEALTACPSGTRLPTIRELAKISMQSDDDVYPEGWIRETSEVEFPNFIPYGWYKVAAINPDGQRDVFFFNYRFSEPSDLWNTWFWSSSWEIAFGANSGHLLLLGKGGFLGFGPRTGNYGAVQCIPAE